jgi:hypothetical protein
MRHSLILLAAASLAAVFSFGSGPAQAASLPKIDHVTTEHTGAEPVGYYRRRGYWGRPYRYWGPRYPRTYRYARPYNYYYGPPYGRYYGYWNRPYYGPRYYY